MKTGIAHIGFAVVLTALMFMPSVAADDPEPPGPEDCIEDSFETRNVGESPVEIDTQTRTVTFWVPIGVPDPNGWYPALRITMTCTICFEEPEPGICIPD